MPELGTVLDGQYRLVQGPSAHDLGLVFRAQDIIERRDTEILFLSQAWGSGVSALQGVEENQRMQAGLSDSGLIPFERFGLLGSQLYLVRSHAEGRTLADLLEQRGRLAAQDAVELTIRLCEILNVAHQAGLAHGSLSTFSVFLRKMNDGRWAVTLQDTGVLPALSAPAVAEHRPWGRAPYLSPEQAAGKRATIASDVYVLGSLLYEMLAGRPPFRSKDESVLTFQHMRQQHPSLQILAPDAPESLVQIVNQALAKDPSVRYRTAGQLGHILRTQARQPRPAPRPEPKVARQDVVQEQLVVPPPPGTGAAQAWSTNQIYGLEEADAWGDEQEGVDWLLVGLLIAAMVAVLGLVPLWRTVYKRYVEPIPATYPASRFQMGPGTALAPTGPAMWESQGSTGHPWPSAPVLESRATAASGLPALEARNLSGCVLVWESSLRVLIENCSTLPT